ncbi:AraC family transcriptional regulator [Streptomyces fumigatiscleroticus]|nr:AraC family transcriptional regulator [Streptomyces fumigatiscleroticus]
MPTILDSTDADVTGEHLSRLYSRIQVADRYRHHLTVTQDSLGPVTWHRFDYHHGSVDFALDPLSVFVLINVERGTVPRIATGDYEGGRGVGDLFCFHPGLPSAGRIDYSAHDSIMLPPALLERVAAAPGASPKPVRLTGHVPTAPPAALLLRRTIAHLRGTVCAEPELREQPLVQSTASQLLAATVLAAFPSTALTEPTGRERNDARPATLRRALSYIDDHADQDISVADIAAAARINVRTLQYAFRRYLDTTPTRHLRRVRLAHVHHDLLAADPAAGVTVTTVAGRWGFFHPGQFAAAYRGVYGCLPRRTLYGQGRR